MSKREDEVTGWLDSLRADAERASANQPQPDTAIAPPRRRRRRRSARQWLQDTFSPEPAPDLPAGTDVGSSALVRQGTVLRGAGVQSPPANFPRRYFDPYAALRDASESVRPLAADATSTPQSRRPARVPGRPDPATTGTIGPDTRSRTQRALDEERSRERRQLQERPAAIRALDYAGAGGAQTLTLGYRDELLGALSPVSTAEDFRERETLRREAATGGDRASGIAGAILGAAVPIGAQNALLARGARLAPEGTATRAALESFGTTGARTRLGDVARGVAEGLPYDLAYDYEDGESRGANLAIGALAGGVAGGLLRPGGGRAVASEEPFVRPSSRRVRRGEGMADLAADRMDEIVRPRPGRESGFLAADLNIDRTQEGAEVVPTWLRQLEADAARRRAPEASAGVTAPAARGGGDEVDLDAWARALPEGTPVPGVAPAARNELPATAATSPVPDVAPAPAGQIDQAAEDAYRARRADINGQVRAGTLSREDADKRLKALGMRRAAERRRETGQLTDRERAAEARREASNYTGKRVVVQTEDGPVNGAVIGNTFGRVRVQMEDGSVISAMPDAVSPANAGAATPDLLNLVARTGTGAVVGGAAGGALDSENPTRGAAVGALAGAGLGAASMRGAINADANFAARRRAGLELAGDLRNRPRTEAGFVRTNTDEMATATPATTQRNRTGFPLALGPDRQVDPLRLPDTEALMDAGRAAVRPLQNQYGAVGDLSRLKGQAPPVPIWTGKRRGSDPTENPGVYYHVAPEGYRAGDPLKSFFRLREQGVEPEWKWDFDFADGGYEDGTRIALHDNLPEAADFQKEYGGQLLRVEIPENSGLFGGVNVEGYPYVEGEIPAEFIRPASTASTGAAGDFETSRNASVPRQDESQTRTPQFNRWFGNSKIVDDSGEPLVVYKGMWPPDQRQEPMSSINRREFGGFPAYNGDEPDVDIAGFFTSSKDVANQFAQGVNSRGGHGPSVYPVYLSIQKPYVIDAKGNYAGEYQFGPEGKPFRDAIRSGNYDGVVIRNTGDEGDVYIPLHPEQIKSAIGNSGNFDPRNPDIAGAADPRLLGAVARTGAGALAGAAIDREDPLRGAAIGAGVGAAGPAIARSVARRAGNRIGAVGDISTLRTASGTPRFYSRLENAVRGGQNAAPASQWLRYLDGHPAGIAKGEREWTGVDAWLRERGNQKVTRAELEQYLAQNRVRVGEVGYGATQENKARQKELHDSYSAAVEASKGIEQQLLAALRATSIEPWAEASAISEIRQWGSAAIDASAHFRDVPVQQRVTIYRLMDEFKGAESVIQRHDEVLRSAQEATKGRYAGYQVAGGEPGTYREVLLTLDNDRLRSAPDDWRMEQDGSLWSVRDGDDRRLSANQNREAALREALDKFNAEQGNSVYRGPHWDEPNTMAHIRLDDRTLPDGERVLFMQEAQSDWHQQGREHGYSRNASNAQEDELYRALAGQFGGTGKSPVPDAPFKNTDEWLGLTLKRAVDEAVEGGYDRLAWSTGDQIWKVVSNDPKNLEGMREFYDKIIPRWLAKYGKKLGVEVEPIRLPGMENEMYRTEWVGPELTDDVMREMAERAEPYYRADILHVMNATANPQQRAHALVHLMETGSDGFRTEMEYLLGSNPVQRVLDEGAGGTNLSIRITPALRETVQRQGQALYSFPGPILDALKTQAGQAAAGAGLGLAMEPDHPLYGALAGSAGALGVRVGYLRTSGRKMRNAIRRGTARVALSQFTDAQLEQLAKRYERLVPDVAATMRGEVGERAARRTLTPQQIADRDVALLAEGPLKPVRQRVTRTLTAPEQSAITDAYRSGNEHVRRRIIDELEAAADDASPAVERAYSRLIGGLELEGFDPLPSRANPVLDAGRYANLSSFGLDPTGERRLADHVRRIAEAEGLDPKQRVTWEETKQVARELGMQPTDVSALAKSTRGLTAAELLAVRNQVRENVEGIERSSLRLAQMDGLETAEASLERQLLRQGIEQAEAQNTLLLSRFIRERSDAGRNLNALKILANQTMDPVVWRERAAAALKARGLEFQEAVHGARIREIIESCG